MFRLYLLTDCEYLDDSEESFAVTVKWISACFQLHR